MRGSDAQYTWYANPGAVCGTVDRGTARITLGFKAVAWGFEVRRVSRRAFVASCGSQCRMLHERHTSITRASVTRALHERASHEHYTSVALRERYTSERHTSITRA